MSRVVGVENEKVNNTKEETSVFTLFINLVFPLRPT